MLKKIKYILTTQTFNQSLVTTGSSIINGGLGLVFYFLTARTLGTHGFGAFSVGVAIVTTFSGMLDLGFDQTLVRFINKNLDKKSYYPLVKFAFVIKLALGFLSIILSILFARFFTNLFHGFNNLFLILTFSGIGIASQALFSFSITLARSFQRYYLWGGLYIFTNLIRLVLFLIITAVGIHTSSAIFFLYAIIPLFGFLVSLVFLDTKFVSSKIDLKLLREVVPFNSWIIGANITNALGSRLDTFLTAKFKDLPSTGIYSLSNTLVSVYPQVINAIGAVTTPKFASFGSHKHNSNYTRFASLMALAFAIGGAFVIVPLAWFAFIFSKIPPQDGFPSFLCLLLSMIIFLATTPTLDSIMYFYGRTKFAFMLSLMQVILYPILSWWLIPLYGILGSSLVVLITAIVSTIISVAYLAHISKQAQSLA